MTTPVQGTGNTGATGDVKPTTPTTNPSLLNALTGANASSTTALMNNTVPNTSVKTGMRNLNNMTGGGTSGTIPI
ncbi:MAG: hypothetical protein JSR46_02495 [Verrucomicrobia bacterium]|nr:hypothetical protein [Verrucomicrobiota bacterium]